MKELKAQLVSALLVILTAAGLVCAGINFQQNFQQDKKFPLPEDGVTWVDRTTPQGEPSVVALEISPDSPAARSLIKTGDRLVKINGSKIGSSVDATITLVGIGILRSATYTMQREGIEFDAKVIVRERIAASAIYYQYAVGLLYLITGMFVFFRRSRAPRAMHFYILCLASFVLSSFHYTGKLNSFDKVIYWGNVIAGVFAPTIFLHFALTFPAPRTWLRTWWRTVLLYVPAVLFTMLSFGFASGVAKTAVSLLELRWTLDQFWLLLLSVAYLLGALALSLEFRRTKDMVIRQQLKWLRNGVVLGAVPFTAISVVPYLMGVVPGPYMSMASLFLALIPITWAYAILRYRLMDVDLIFQQGYAYTLATLSVLGIFYALILTIKPLEEMDPSAIALLIMIAAFIFQPIRNWMQEQLDRYWFFKDKYDYRKTLIESARELSSETDLDMMMRSVVDRIKTTLGIQNVAIFLSEGDHYEPCLHTNPAAIANPETLDLSFLRGDQKGPLFFERSWAQLDMIWRDWSPSVKQTVSKLDLNYYLPCQVRGRTIAFLGIGRTAEGEFPTSQDMELLVTLSGYVGIAIENARLYSSLQQKAAEYERLKEFSENIVESINVGIVAADLNDRVESWNSQMETLTGISRESAMDSKLTDLFPRRLSTALEEVRGQTGIHQIYKLPVRDRWRATGKAERLVNVAVAPLVTKDQEQIGRLIIFDDITERAHLEQQLVQADKLSSIGLMAAGIAHEVNTPLAVISTYAQMLTKQVSGDEKKAVMLEKIANQTFRASEIVNSLLNFSRTSNTEFEEVDLNKVVRDTVSLVGPQLQNARVEVTVQTDDSSPTIRGNFGKLQQVFLNLIMNAKDAMEEGGTLKITTRADDETARIEITDTGKGIEPSDMARIYDPFFTTKSPKKGTGLGLSVTYGIVHEHSGNIEVKSQPGEGTTFLLDFPLARKPVAA
jgi:PAS domain S-box-containing protein